MSYKLPLHGEVTFTEKDIGENAMFIFHSKLIIHQPDVKVNIDNTAVNLISADGDRLLHCSIRRAEDAIVFNSQPTGGNWGREERVKLHGVFVQTDATITLKDLGDRFQILADGTFLYHYTKRIQKAVVKASYSANSGSALSDPLELTLWTPDSKEPLKPPIRATSYQQAYFPITAAEVAKESEEKPFDVVIIGSGIGGGVLAADLLAKNKRLKSSTSSFGGTSTSGAIPSMYNRSAAAIVDDSSLRILVIERGGLKFNTHSLNMPRPTNRGPYGQMNDLFYNHFKEDWDMDEDTKKIWKGGPVYCLGGRSTVWGLFAPRIDLNTFRSKFHPDVFNELNDTYLRKAEETMNLSFPQTLPLHRALMDKLNTRDRASPLPTTQWEWGRVASEFTSNKNFDFAEGAYSTVDKLLEAAMDDVVARTSDRKFQIILESPVARLEPQPVAGSTKKLTHVVVNDGINEHKIRCNSAVVSAGTVESAAILLRSTGSATPKAAYGPRFVTDFGHVTDHYIFFVSLPFFYRNMANRELLGGMKLQTDITFDKQDNTTALANVSLDASSFLPRRNVADSELPQFIIAYILPSQLAHQNTVEIVDGKPNIHVEYADDDLLPAKKEVLLDFACDTMNKVAAVLDIQFVRHPQPDSDYVPIPKVTREILGEIGELGPGGVAHELGSIPMPKSKEDKGGIVDENLKMKYGWDNVYVCDLSVFPYSPAANPTLSLAALALRLSDKLVPQDTTKYLPIIVYNLTSGPVWVTMTLSRTTGPSFGPTARKQLGAGASQVWKRQEKETIFVYSCACTEDFNVQMVDPGINAIIVVAPPAKANCTCAK